APQPDRVADGEEEWGLEPLGQGERRARGRAVGVVVALEQERAAVEPPLAVDQRGDRLALGGSGGEVLGPDRVQIQAKPGAGRRAARPVSTAAGVIRAPPRSSAGRAGRPWPGRKWGRVSRRPGRRGNRWRIGSRARPRRRGAAPRPRTARARTPRPAPRAPRAR